MLFFFPRTSVLLLLIQRKPHQRADLQKLQAMADEATLDKFRDLTSVSSKLILPVIQLHLFSCEVKNGVQMNNAEFCVCMPGRGRGNKTVPRNIWNQNDTQTQHYQLIEGRLYLCSELVIVMFWHYSVKLQFWCLPPLVISCFIARRVDYQFPLFQLNLISN